jgi:hypothetical protein
LGCFAQSNWTAWRCVPAWGIDRCQQDRGSTAGRVQHPERAVQLRRAETPEPRLRSTR